LIFSFIMFLYYWYQSYLRVVILNHCVKYIYKRPVIYPWIIGKIATPMEVERIHKLSMEFAKMTLIRIVQRMKMVENTSYEYKQLSEFKVILENLIEDGNKLD